MDSKLRCVFESPDEKKAQSEGMKWWLSECQKKKFMKKNCLFLDEAKLKQNSSSGNDAIGSSGTADDKVSNRSYF